MPTCPQLTVIPGGDTEPPHWLAFHRNGVLIRDPFLDANDEACDPEVEYGIPEAVARRLAALNAAMQDVADAAVDAALNEGCRRIQDVLGVPSGDTAGLFYSGSAREALLNVISASLADYARQEMAYLINGAD